MFKKLFQILLFFFFFFFSLIQCKMRPRQSTVADGKESGDSSNRVAIGWVLFDDRWDFQRAPERIKSLFTDTEKFGQEFSAARIFSADKTTSLRENNSEGTGESFVSILESGLSFLADKENPEVFLNINSHGGHGLICRQCGADIKHEEFTGLIYATAAKVDPQRKIKINIAYSACHSFSMAESVKKEQGLDPKRRVTLVSNAAPEMLGHGEVLVSELGKMIQFVNKISSEDRERLCTDCSPFELVAKLLHSFGSLNQSIYETTDWIRSYSTVHKMDSWTANSFEVLTRLSAEHNLNWDDAIEFNRRASANKDMRQFIALKSPLDFERFEAAVVVQKMFKSDSLPNLKYSAQLKLYEISRREILSGLYSGNVTLHLPAARALAEYEGQKFNANDHHEIEEVVEDAQERYRREFEPALTAAIDSPDSPLKYDVILGFLNHRSKHIANLAVVGFSKIADTDYLAKSYLSRAVEGSMISHDNKYIQMLIVRRLFELKAPYKTVKDVFRSHISNKFVYHGTEAFTYIYNYWLNMDTIPDVELMELYRSNSFALDVIAGKIKEKEDSYHRLSRIIMANFDLGLGTTHKLKGYFSVDSWNQIDRDPEVSKFLKDKEAEVKVMTLAYLRDYPVKTKNVFNVLPLCMNLPKHFLDDPSFRREVVSFLDRVEVSDEFEGLERQYPSGYISYRRLREFTDKMNLNTEGAGANQSTTSLCSDVTQIIKQAP